MEMERLDRNPVFQILKLSSLPIMFFVRERKELKT